MVDFSEYDDAFAAPTPAATIPDHSVIDNGYYTLTFPDGSHRTFRIHTQRESAKWMPGQRILSVLIGPENTTDYERFAFVNEDGISVWKRYKNTKLSGYADLIWMLATGCEAEGYELLVSKRCLRCNRTLTDAASVKRGIGPECWEMLHG